MAECGSVYGVLATFVLLIMACESKGTENTELENILQRLTALESQHIASQNEVRRLSSTVKEQQITLNKQEDKINQLEREQRFQKKVASDITGRINKNKDELADLYEAVLQNLPEHTHDAVNHKGEKIGSGNVTGGGQNTAGYQHLRKYIQKKQNQANGIAFTAYLSHDLELGTRQPIIYDKVLLNDGNSYDATTGIFTCQMSGIHLFMVFIGESGDHAIRAELKINKAYTVDVAVATTNTTQSLQGGNAATVRLNQGDRVAVDAIRHAHVEGSDRLRTSTFTGLFLYP